MKDNFLMKLCKYWSGIETWMKESCRKKNGKTFEITEWICHISNESHTSGSHVVSSLPLLQGQPHYQQQRYFLTTVPEGRTTLQVHMWIPYYRFCRENHTASTNVISFLPFIHRDPNCKYTCDFLTTVSVGRATLQSHLWIVYYRGGCEGSIIYTYSIDRSIRREYPNVLLWSSLFPHNVTRDLESCPIKIFIHNWETFLSIYLSFFFFAAQ
jgi:hypothetical protein